jgi:hypothetical protein
MTSEYFAAKKERQRVFGLSYKKRLAEFSSSAVEREHSLGFATWYGATGSSASTMEHYLTGATLYLVDVVGCTLPRPLTFTPSTLGKYFNAGEDVPCIMRGSIYALSLHGRSHAENVFERQVMRWLRKSKITCLSNQEWRGIIYEDFWRTKARRLRDRYCQSSKWWGMDWLKMLVNTFCPIDPRGESGGSVLIDGKLQCVDGEQLAALKDMHRLERKLRVPA